MTAIREASPVDALLSPHLSCATPTNRGRGVSASHVKEHQVGTKSVHQ